MIDVPGLGLLKGRLAGRMAGIEPFYVMDLLARARKLEAEGCSIIHMEVGEPDYITPQPIIDAGIKALSEGRTHYTPALGLPALRQAIANFYLDTYKVNVPADRIIVTPGASGALLLALGVLINPGDEVLMADPGYPCNRHFVRMFEGQAASISVTEADNFQLCAEHIDRNWQPNTVATLLATPSNPTGTIVSSDEMQKILNAVSARGGCTIVDEIYSGLTYGHDHDAVSTALSLSDEVFVINSFSKYFGMTGWRLGWLVVPEIYVDAIDRLAQNVFLAPSTPAQFAALAAFEPQTLAILEQRRAEFERRRNYLLPALQTIGFNISSTPQGAFYLYANCSKFADDSYMFALDLLETIGVAVTPGRDFGTNHAENYIRFAYTTGLDKLEEGVERLEKYLSK